MTWSVTRYFSSKFYLKKKKKSEFSYVEIWFSNQSSKLLETEDKINITLVSNWSVKYKIWDDIQLNLGTKCL